MRRFVIGIAGALFSTVGLKAQRAGIQPPGVDLRAFPASPNRSDRPANTVDGNSNLGRGIVAERAGGYTEAIKWLTAATQESGDTKKLALAYCFRGIALRHLERWDEALHDFLKAIALDPRLDDAYSNASYIYTRTNRYREALQLLTRAIELRTDNKSFALHWSERRDAYFRLGDYQKAQTDFVAAVRSGPGDTNALNDAAWFRATCPEASYRNGQEAISLASHACSVDKWKDANEIDTLAAAHAETGNFTEAERFELKALSVLGSDSERRGKFEKRLALYRAHRAVRQYRND